MRRRTFLGMSSGLGIVATGLVQARRLTGTGSTQMSPRSPKSDRPSPLALLRKLLLTFLPFPRAQ